MRGLLVVLAIQLIFPLFSKGEDRIVDWVKVTDRAGWRARDSCGEAVYKGRLWLLGGWFDSFSAPPRDVWSSPDGKAWDLLTREAPWKLKEVANATWSPRAYHAAVVHDGKIWVLGGGNYVPQYLAQNDVWSSSDGAHWERATEHAPWAPRIWFSAVAYRDRIWVLGGWSNNPSRNWGDVWYSRDGKEWTELRSNVVWKMRHEHSAYVFQDKIWVAGGHAQPLNSEVWSLEVPRDWFDVQATK